jgi:hypothetical protein
MVDDDPAGGTDLEDYANATYKDPPSLAASPGTNMQLASNDPNYLKVASKDDATGDDPTGGGQDPRGGAGVPDRGDFVEGIERQLAPLRQQQKDLQDRALKAQQAGLDQEAENIRRFEARTAQRPKPKELPLSPQEFSQDAVNYLQITALVGALAGTLTRGNTTAALNAFNGAVKGFMSGNEEVFKAKTAEWKMTSERIREDNKAQMDAYDEILKDETLDANMKQRHIQNIAKMYDNQMIWNQAAQGDILKTGMLIEKQRQYEQNAEDARTKMYWNVEKAKAEIEKLRNPSIGRGMENDVYAARIAQFKKENNGEEPTGDQKAEIAQDVRGGMRGAGALGTRAGGLIGIIDSLDEQIGPAKELSAKVPRNLIIPSANRLEVTAEAWRNTKGGQNAAKFLLDNYTIADLYARALNPTGVARTAQIDEALKILNYGYTHNTYAAALDELRLNIQRERTGTLKALHGGLNMKPPPGTQPPPIPPATDKGGGGGGLPPGWTVETQ